jgi:hypothetical protein
MVMMTVAVRPVTATAHAPQNSIALPSGDGSFQRNRPTTVTMVANGPAGGRGTRKVRPSHGLESGSGKSGSCGTWSFTRVLRRGELSTDIRRSNNHVGLTSPDLAALVTEELVP